LSTNRKILGLLTAADLTALLLCLFAAMVFWFFNAMSHHDYTGEISYPIKIEYPTDNLIPVRPLPDRILLNATGSGWDILRKSFQFGVEPLLFHPRGIPTKKRFTADEILPPLSHQFGDIKINYLLSDTMDLDFDYVGKKQVVVKLDSAHISLADNYRIVTPIYIEPDTIMLTGALKEIEKTPGILYLSLSHKKLKGAFSDDVPLIGFNRSLVNSNVQSVHVGFATKRFISVSKSFPLCQLNFPEGITILQKEDVKVDFLLAEDNEELFSKTELKVCVDYLKQNSDGKTLIPVVVNVPSYVKSYTITPAAINVYYTE